MSVIGNEFSGLPIADLIGAPLKAACDAQIRLANATASFINNIGFNTEPSLAPDGTRLKDAAGRPLSKLVPRQVDFSFWKPVAMNTLGVGATATLAVFVPGVSGNTITGVKIKNIAGDMEVITFLAPIPWTTDDSATATLLASAINSKGPLAGGYTASASGTSLSLTAPSGSGTSVNSCTVDITTTGALKYVQGTFAGGTDEGGDAQVQKVVLSVPFLAIVNIPSLMVKNVDITFDMEVKSSESHKDDLSEEVAIDATVKLDLGFISAEVKVHAALSAHQENTRSTDRSAKYHVSVSARDDGMPEGLSRVLDMLQKAISPIGVSSAIPASAAGLGATQAALPKAA